ncbi:hypothetical protein UFOVP1299_47 [uncultured Caudovirales phage]|uniref:Uncharacterized protein n=1 Tax=uncultured Caudovirales phage TaxID=2100421 RepID=A0A6J5RJ22_9CAUD|nr:hypothetical protein UFOVP1299_47 [uncultured Caudovirales phage]
MKANEYKGEVTIVLQCKPCLVVYDWDALRMLEKSLGEDYRRAIGAALDRGNVDTIAKVLSIGLAKNHSEYTAVAVHELNLPLTEVTDVIITALRQSMHGPAKMMALLAEEDASTNPLVQGG